VEYFKQVRKASKNPFVSFKVQIKKNKSFRSVTPELNWKYFMYWTSIHEEITAPANQAPCMFVDILLKNIYDCLTPVQKLDVLREKPPKICPQLWTVLRLDAIEDSMQSNRVHASLITQTIPLMEFFLKETNTVQNYDEIVSSETAMK
jgi:hypothetical protein